MTAKVFVDSNVLIYAHDLDARTRQQRAAECLKRNLATLILGRHDPRLLTEDLNHGQIIAGVKIINPFLTG